MTSSRQVVTFARYSGKAVLQASRKTLASRPVAIAGEIGEKWKLDTLGTAAWFSRGPLSHDLRSPLKSRICCEGNLKNYDFIHEPYPRRSTRRLCKQTLKRRKEVVEEAGPATIQSLVFSSTEIPRERTRPFSDIATIYFTLNRWFRLNSTSTRLIIYILDISVKKRTALWSNLAIESQINPFSLKDSIGKNLTRNRASHWYVYRLKIQFQFLWQSWGNFSSKKVEGTRKYRHVAG